MSPRGIPLIADFGLSRILVLSKAITSTKDAGGSIRWMAPELLKYDECPDKEDGGVSVPSVKSDVWAFGVTIMVR